MNIPLFQDQQGRANRTNFAMQHGTPLTTCPQAFQLLDEVLPYTQQIMAIKKKFFKRYLPSKTKKRAGSIA